MDVSTIFPWSMPFVYFFSYISLSIMYGLFHIPHSFIAHMFYSWFVTLFPTLTLVPVLLLMYFQVQSIKHDSYFISIPTLSVSSQPSLKALAEHGIGIYLF
ncbi:hypothetical protein F5J12DRAFT_112699 [Pisolithus orientalis]|uniref:uncharacterized protein n=1 Tax=Pisolithus orientalis TaxID=936130 RepID=UPI002225544C|nr:uncharacterized protein F5J12DRAFT_112699 [Pisolithus orientalis]KAI6006237.1 hypothetical protein F5J12DRAFT_112699 [Pisolithus orientalis]